MDLEWPRIGPDLLICIQKYFKTPLLLDAAFDGHDDAETLVRSVFPDAIPEEASDLAASLLVWKESAQRSLKRARKDIVSSVMFQLPCSSHETVQDACKRISQTNVLSLIEAHLKRRQKLFRLEAESRAKRSDAERKKYSMLLAQISSEAQLPVAALIQTLDDPQQGWLHLFGTRRCNTLKNRYQAWRPFAVWLEFHFGRKFPVSLRDIIDYVQHRVNEGCGKSVPEGFHVSLCLLEQLGRVPEAERLSNEELWKSHVKAWTAELASKCPAVKPAEMYTVAILLALELIVVDDAVPVFARALAWVVLVMVWSSMRCDDMQSALPHRTTLSNYGLRVVLAKTKTSGPDKVQKEVSLLMYAELRLSLERIG
eukprot:s800_g9.t1